MAKIQAVWALDIGQAALKALKLVPGETPDQVVAEAFDFIEYPKILSQPDADPEELVREAMATFLERNDVKGCRVAIGVPGQAGLVKFIKLPPVEKKRIPDIVKFEARQQIPFALEEVVWDCQQIGTGGRGRGLRPDRGRPVRHEARPDPPGDPAVPAWPGIEVDIVQMGPIALYNFIAYDQLRPHAAARPPRARRPPGRPPTVEPGGSIVLLDIGADNTDLIITDGTRIWQRNVPIGGNHFTRALTKELKLTFAKAEHLKRNATKAPDPRAVFTAMRGVFNDFASEVNRSIGFYVERQPPGQDRQGHRPGQRLQAAGPAEVPPAEPEPGGREARGLRPAGRRGGHHRPAVPGEPAVVRRRLRPGRPGARPRRPADEPAARRDRPGPADPGQEAVGPAGRGAADARLLGAVPGRLPGPGEGRQRGLRVGRRAGHERQEAAATSSRATTTPDLGTFNGLKGKGEKLVETNGPAALRLQDALPDPQPGDLRPADRPEAPRRRLRRPGEPPPASS